MPAINQDNRQRPGEPARADGFLTVVDAVSGLRGAAEIPSLIVAGAVYFLLAKVSMLFFAVQPANIALLWLPAGFGLYLYSCWGAKALAIIFLASFPASFPGMAHDTLWQQVLHTTVTASADVIFAFAAGTLLRRRLGGSVEAPSELFDFILYCCFIPLVFSTLVLGTNLWLGGYLAGDEAALTGVAVFVADFLGVLLIYPLFPAWERRNREAASITGIGIIATLLAFASIVASFFGPHWLLYFSLPALIYVVIDAKFLYAFLATSASVILYNVMSASIVDMSVAGGEWLEVLSFSCAVTIAVLAMSIQQRSLLAEKGLREQWMITANHDGLTGLPNRGHIRFMIKHEIARLKRSPGTFCLCMLDIDNFKAINDTHGHHAGDRVLVELGRRLKRSFRESDVISRYGGEEFLVLLLDVKQEDASRLMDRVRQKIADEPFVVGEESIRITFSAGLAEFEAGDGDTLLYLLDLADQRLYEAKRLGRNRVVG